jgi:hypothetical protein
LDTKIKNLVNASSSGPLFYFHHGRNAAGFLAYVWSREWPGMQYKTPWTTLYCSSTALLRQASEAKASPFGTPVGVRVRLLSLFFACSGSVALKSEAFRKSWRNRYSTTPNFRWTDTPTSPATTPENGSLARRAGPHRCYILFHQSWSFTPRRDS